MTIFGIANSILDDVGRMMAARTHDEWNAAYASLHPMGRFDDLDKLLTDAVQRAAPIGLAPVALERTERLMASLCNVRLLALRIPSRESNARERFNENMLDERAAIQEVFDAMNDLADLIRKLKPAKGTTPVPKGRRKRDKRSARTEKATTLFKKYKKTMTDKEAATKVNDELKLVGDDRYKVTTLQRYAGKKLAG